MNTGRSAFHRGALCGRGFTCVLSIIYISVQVRVKRSCADSGGIHRHVVMGFAPNADNDHMVLACSSRSDLSFHLFRISPFPNRCPVLGIHQLEIQVICPQNGTAILKRKLVHPSQCSNTGRNVLWRNFRATCGI